MSTLGSLMSLLGDTGIKPYNEQELTANRIRFGTTQNQTQLLELADLKRQQEAAAQARAYFAAHPQAALGHEGGPVLGSLQTAPPGPPGGPLTQQTTLPGQPPGAPQVVPGGQDLSRFATQGSPPQSTLAALAPPPQATPLEQLMRTNPDAAFQVIGQQQKMVTTQLTMREKTAEAVASTLQGVTSQESYEAAVQDLMQWAPQQAARLPKVWSREAMQPIIESALSAKDKATLQIQTTAAQAELAKARMSGRVASTDQYLKALGVTPGQETPQDMQRALELQTQHQAQIQAANVSPQLIQGEGGGYWAVNPRTLEKRPVPGEGSTPASGGGGTTSGQSPSGDQLRAPMTSEDKKQAGYLNRAQEGLQQLETIESSGDYTAWTVPAQSLPGGRLLLSDKQKQYETAKGVFLQGILRRDSAGQITTQEWNDYGRIYFPVPGDGPKDVAQKARLRQQYLDSEQATLGRPSGQPQAPGRTGTQAPPTRQGASGGQGSPSTSQGPVMFDRTDFLKWRTSTGKGGNPTQADVEAYFQAKGLKRR